MPTYEYKCTNEGTTFDIWQEVGSSAPPCPNCGAPTKKVFRPTRTIFKGSGFYVTDTRAESSGGKTSAAKTEGDSSAAESSATDAKTETKAETPKTDASAPKSE